ncbi:MAG TPA: DUF2950 domain-containing protein, partial [Terracidiphilus sp.]
MFIQARKVMIAAGLLLMGLSLPLGCKSTKPQPEITGYATPDDAANALIVAAKARDMDALT